MLAADLLVKQKRELSDCLRRGRGLRFNISTPISATQRSTNMPWQPPRAFRFDICKSSSRSLVCDFRTTSIEHELRPPVQ